MKAGESGRSARDDAIAAIAERLPPVANRSASAEWLLDAIPNDVLVRLAIERGALEQAGYVWKTSQGIQWGGPEGTGHYTEAPVYRVVES